MSKKTSRIIVLICALAAITIFAFFLKDVLIPFIGLELRNDYNGANELLRSKGVFGFLAVILVEALQMVVIFIPAEFIQLSSGLSYPPYIALLLCDAGVCLGASLIFLLVRTFRVQSESYEKRKKDIDRLAKKKGDRSTVLFMLLLFITPLIPFGAICWYGSSTKIRYRNYIAAVCLGVIPSIVSSILMGAAGKAFIKNAIPFWLLIVVIILIGAALFTVLFIFINKYYLKGTDGTPDSPLQTAFCKLMNFMTLGRFKVNVSEGIPESVKAPYVMLFNHQCFYDILFALTLDDHNNPSFVGNEYFLFHNPLLRRFPKKFGVIPKKLFTNDFVTAAGIFRMIKKGYPVAIFPEARLSPDGRTNPIAEQSGRFYRKLGVDLVLVNISGAYFGLPKWRKKIFRTKVDIKVAKVLTKEELETLTDDEINGIINETLIHDASCEDFNIYPQRGKANGLENVLYRCIHCGTLYSTKGKGNEFRCTACGKHYHINDRYRFDEEIDGKTGTISGYYEKIRELELSEYESLDLKTEVRTKIFDKNVKLRSKESGICTFTPAGFTYKSESVEFSIPAEEMLAIPFSCGTEFETYHDGELYYFYPVENKMQTARWGLISDIMREMHEKGEK